ncbi:MAG TPA: hypothetical protein VF294_11960, partial [Polyangiaceae bacterium]
MKTKSVIAHLAFLAAFGALGAQPASADTKPPSAPAPATTTKSVSTEQDRKQVSITVYNQNFGLVREVRELSQLGAGKVELEFRDVAANIQPETVHI